MTEAATADADVDARIRASVQRSAELFSLSKRSAMLDFAPRCVRLLAAEGAGAHQLTSIAFFLFPHLYACLSLSWLFRWQLGNEQQEGAHPFEARLNLFAPPAVARSGDACGWCWCGFEERRSGDHICAGIERGGGRD